MNVVDIIAGICMIWGIIWGIFIPTCLILVPIGFLLMTFSSVFLNDE